MGRKDDGETNTPTQPRSPAFVCPSEESVDAYRLEAERGHLFTRMPRFCGCTNLPRDPHKSLLDCFIDEDGTFDRRAAVCGLRIAIALDAADWQDEGARIAEVRKGIDEK